MRSGLEVLLDDVSALKGARVALCCNHTATDRRLHHAIDLLRDADVDLVRLFGPEHGIRATAQDMEGVDENVDPVSGLETVSLYGDDEASLRPDPATLEDVDILIFDIQDIGARYYTYQATLGFMMEVAGTTDTQVIVLDRPNPINGLSVEGNLVAEGFESFVGAYPIANRHGMTVGELAGYFKRFCGVDCSYEVVRCEGWRRSMWFDEGDLPWIYPSPNMPTLETAILYPGMCLIEATNLSEGRGTTRPFHLVGAPWLDPDKLAGLCAQRAAQAGLKGVGFRPAAFTPGFQKHAGSSCRGVEVHLLDRRVHALLLGMVVVEACRQADPENFAWRTEAYEFVEDPIAIDLLIGRSDYREAVEAGTPVREVLESWEPQRREFIGRREGCLLY